MKKITHYSTLAVIALLLCISCSKNKEASDPMMDIVVKTGDATEIYETTAKISGSVTLPTYETSFAKYGVEIAETESMVSIRKVEFTGYRLSDDFSVDVTALSPDTKYYYRTYATLNGKSKNAEVKSFSTIP